MNVFAAIEKHGHDEDFIPIADESFLATSAPAGSAEKIDVMRSRVQAGQPLWHPDDKLDYNGIRGGIRASETKHHVAGPGIRVIEAPSSSIRKQLPR